jgi:hypothetical protein
MVLRSEGNLRDPRVRDVVGVDGIDVPAAVGWVGGRMVEALVCESASSSAEEADAVSRLDSGTGT